MKKVYKFNDSLVEDVGFEKVMWKTKTCFKPRSLSFYGVVERNTDRYIDWVLERLECEKPLPPMKKFYAPCISMNTANVEKLNRYIDTWVWVSLSPKEDDSLLDDEYSIDTEKMFEEQEDMEVDDVCLA